MPKNEKEDQKKKVVIVEEISEANEPSKEEKSDDSLTSEVPVISEAKKEDSEKVVESELIEEDKPNYLWIIVPTALLVGALVGGLITYFSGISNLGQNLSTPTPVATVFPKVEETPQASPSSTLKRDEVKVQILNGSGVAGAAGKVKTLLEGLGYKDVDTGNAPSTDVAVTEVSVKESSKEFSSLMIKDLSKNYEAVEASKPLAASSKYDIVITLGKK